VGYLANVLIRAVEQSEVKTRLAEPEWITSQKTTGRKKDAGRQGLLAELAAYADNSDEIGFRAMSEVWVDAVRALAFDLLRHKAAVARLQDTHYDEHLILAPDTETGLDAIIQTTRQAAQQLNEYLTARGKPRSPFRIDIDALSPSVEDTKSLADYWLSPARDEAILDVLNWMGDAAGRDAHRRDMVKRMMGYSDGRD